MSFWKDREGKEVTREEFFTRWKSGREKARQDPILQIANSLVGYNLVLAGIITGMIISFFNKQYWLVLILAGSFLISKSGLNGTLPRYKALKKIEEEMKGGEEE